MTFIRTFGTVQLLTAILLLYCFFSTRPALGQSPPQTAHFVGAESCKSCHANVYDSWKKTSMANVVHDPKEHPESVIGEFKNPDPLRTFDLDQVPFVYGSRYKQRYFTKRGDDYYPLPAQWDVAAKCWLPFHVGTGTDCWT